MSRTQIRTDTLDPAIILAINTAFVNVADMHCMAGLTIPMSEYYMVLRGELVRPDAVKAVEMGWLRASEVMGIGIPQVLEDLSELLTEAGVLDKVQVDAKLHRLVQVLYGALVR